MVTEGPEVVPLVRTRPSAARRRPTAQQPLVSAIGSAFQSFGCLRTRWSVNLAESHSRILADQGLNLARAAPSRTRSAELPSGSARSRPRPASVAVRLDPNPGCAVIACALNPRRRRCSEARVRPAPGGQAEGGWSGPVGLAPRSKPRSVVLDLIRRSPGQLRLDPCFAAGAREWPFGRSVAAVGHD